MWIYITCIIISVANHFWEADSSDIPDSHVPVLDELIARYLNVTSVPQNSIVDLLLGDVDASGDSTQDLDVNVLNHNALKKIIETEEGKTNTTHYRRQYEHPEITMRDPKNTVLKNKIFQMMEQSIYSAKYRLAETKLIRIKYKENFAYNIGIIVANVYQLVLKCEHMYDEMHHFPQKTFFLFRLIIYEKILACHTDVEDLVRRAYSIQAKIDSRTQTGNATTPKEKED